MTQLLSAAFWPLLLVLGIILAASGTGAQGRLLLGLAVLIAGIVGTRADPLACAKPSSISTLVQPLT